MDEFIAYSSRWRAGALIGLSAIFIVLGLWFLGTFGPVPESRRLSEAILQAIGLLSLMFFGLSAISRLPLLFKQSELLCISSNGLRWTEWSEALIPWSDVAEITTWQSHGQRALIVYLKNADRYPGRGVRALINRLNRGVTGGDFLISMNSTDRTFDEAMAAIERFRV